MEPTTTKTIRIKADTLLRLYGMKATVGMDAANNMPTLDAVINAALDSYLSDRSREPQAPFTNAPKARIQGDLTPA